MRPQLPLLLLALACGSDPAPAPTPAATVTPPAPPSLILITLDTTRRDALGIYGASPSPTPNLDALAQRAVIFDDAWTVAPLTLPAHTSLMTGLYPASHGVRDNATGLVPPDALTLAEHLSAHRYVTAADVAAYVLHPSFGLDQGFGSYTSPAQDERSSSFLVAEHKAEQVVDRALARLPKLKGPYFYWLHLFDAHFPYAPPGAPHTDDGKAGYRAELSYVDDQLGRVLDALAARPDADRTVIVVASDHGESLGDAPESSHGYLVADPTMRIPLLVIAPGIAPQRIAEQVSLVDLMPTLLSLLDLPQPALPMDGVDLTPRLRGGAPPPVRTLALESHYGWIQHGWAPIEAVVEDRWKLIHTRNPALYDRQTDPTESRNLYAPDQPPTTRLRGSLEGHFAQPKHRLPRVSRVSNAEQTAMLRALGYVDEAGSAGREERPDPRGLADVREQMDVADRLGDVFTAETEGRTDDVLRLLRELATQAPDSAYVHRLLGSALLKHAPTALDETEQVLRNAFRLDPEQASTSFNLAALSVRRAIGAQEAARQAGEPSSDASVAAHQLAKQHFDEAERWLRLTLRLQPEQPEALANLAQIVIARANASIKAGHRDAALSGFREGYELLQGFLKQSPPDAPQRAAVAESAERLRTQIDKLSQ